MINIFDYGDRIIIGDSTNWKNWVSVLSLTTCQPCAEKHGTIYEVNEIPPDLPMHFFCKCYLAPMRTRTAGTATTMGLNGADAFLVYTGKLPGYYVTKEEAEDAGWIKWKGNLADVFPGKMIGGDVYRNKNKKLPLAPGRIWYEADIDYVSGFRNTYRILYSKRRSMLCFIRPLQNIYRNNTIGG